MQYDTLTQLSPDALRQLLARRYEKFEKICTHITATAAFKGDPTYSTHPGKALGVLLDKAMADYEPQVDAFGKSLHKASEVNTLFARLAVDTAAIRFGGTFLNRTKEVGQIRKGQRVRVVRLCADRTIEITDALDGVGGLSAKVPLDQLDDLTETLKWADLTDKKGLP